MNVKPNPNALPFRGGFAVHNSGGAWWLHDLFGLIALLIIVAGILLLVRYILRRPAAHRPVGNWAAVHELDLRYARGEIKRDDYLQRRADLLDPAAHLGAGSAPPTKPAS